MSTSCARIAIIIGVVVAAAIPVTPATAADPVRLGYVGRYDCHCAAGRDHLVGVEPVRDHYALVSSYEGLVVIDLDDLPPGGTQTYVDHLPGINAHSTVTRDDGYVYAAQQKDGGIAIVRLAPDLTLSLIGTISEPGVYFGKLTLVGDRLYAPAHAYGIRIYDLSDPASPVLVGSLQEGLVDAFAIALDGQTAYVA
ncbi:MAG: LVIVD repeat-containing protein, partial [Planctomycetota bacterium]